MKKMYYLFVREVSSFKNIFLNFLTLELLFIFVLLISNFFSSSIKESIVTIIMFMEMFLLASAPFSMLIGSLLSDKRVIKDIKLIPGYSNFYFVNKFIAILMCYFVLFIFSLFINFNVFVILFTFFFPFLILIISLIISFYALFINKFKYRFIIILINVILFMFLFNYAYDVLVNYFKTAISSAFNYSLTLLFVSTIALLFLFIWGIIFDKYSEI